VAVFRKILKFHKNRFSRRTDRQTDTQTLRKSDIAKIFQNFANKLKKSLWI